MSMQRTFLSIVPCVVIGGFIVAVLATSNRASRYVSSKPFAGCYVSPDGNRLVLSQKGQIVFNGVAAGSYKILAPVGGKHGDLVEAADLDLMLSHGVTVARSGRGGFFWPIDQQSVRVIFAPSSEIQFQRAAGQNCSKAASNLR